MLSLSTPVPDVIRVHLWSRVGRAVGYTVSAYLAHGVLVDTGCPRVAGEMGALLDRVTVRGAIVTHAHEDHAGNAALLAARGVPILAGAETMRIMRTRSHLPIYRRAVWGEPEPLTGHVATFADERLHLLPAPGHSADHHVVWDPEREWLFGGDLFIGVRVRVAHPGEDPRLLARTLRQLADLRPRWLFDAHRGAVADPAPLLVAKADWIDDRVALVERLADQGVADREIRRRVLGRERWEALGSVGEYSALNFVRAVRAGRTTGPTTATPRQRPHSRGPDDQKGSAA